MPLSPLSSRRLCLAPLTRPASLPSRAPVLVENTTGPVQWQARNAGVRTCVSFWGRPPTRSLRGGDALGWVYWHQAWRAANLSMHLATAFTFASVVRPRIVNLRFSCALTRARRRELSVVVVRHAPPSSRVVLRAAGAASWGRQSRYDVQLLPSRHDDLVT